MNWWCDDMCMTINIDVEARIPVLMTCVIKLEVLTLLELGHLGGWGAGPRRCDAMRANSSELCGQNWLAAKATRGNGRATKSPLASAGSQRIQARPGQVVHLSCARWLPRATWHVLRQPPNPFQKLDFAFPTRIKDCQNQRVIEPSHRLSGRRLQRAG